MPLRHTMGYENGNLARFQFASMRNSVHFIFSQSATTNK
jgi:hypothetical protein